MKRLNIKDDNWSTPPYIYNALNQEFNFDFDPCPLEEGDITPDKDGLLIEWGERNFINPPYSVELKTKFVYKAIEEKRKGKLCVLLLPVSTSTRLFHDHILPNISEPVRFFKGRIKFIGKNKKGELISNGSPTSDSMLIIMDGRDKKC